MTYNGNSLAATATTITTTGGTNGCIVLVVVVVVVVVVAELLPMELGWLLDFRACAVHPCL